jgi:Tol biopolymer transport system component
MRPLWVKLAFVILGLFIGSIWGVRLVGQSSIIPFHELAFYSRKQEHFEIYRADADRGLVVRLTSFVSESIRPAWSPDGTQIAFFSLRANSDVVSGLYLMDVEGHNPRLLSTTVGQSNPAWSPDSRSIIYSSDQRGSEGIYRITVADGVIQQISDKPTSLLAVSPDGRQIAFMSACDNNCDIFVADGDGSNLRQLTRNGLFDVFPVWSPDSQQIAFMSNRDQFFEIYVVDADCTTRPGGCDANARRLTYNRDFDGFPNWSPDGQRLVLSSDRGGNFDLYTIDVTCMQNRGDCAAATQRLTDEPGRDLSPVWSPDGQRIAFISGRDVYVMDADGQNIRHLMDDVLPDQFLAWRP